MSGYGPNTRAAAAKAGLVETLDGLEFEITNKRGVKLRTVVGFWIDDKGGGCSWSVLGICAGEAKGNWTTSTVGTIYSALRYAMEAAKGQYERWEKNTDHAAAIESEGNILL